MDLSNKSQEFQLAGSVIHAGIRRSAIANAGHSHFLGTQHVKAHRSLAAIDLLPNAEKALALANCKADSLAKEALRKCGLMPSPAILQDTEQCLEKQRAILETIAAVLQVFPREGTLCRLPPLTAEEKAANKVARAASLAKQKAELVLANTLHGWHRDPMFGSAPGVFSLLTPG